MQKKNKSKVDLSGEKNIPLHVVAVFGIVKRADKYLIAKRSSQDPQAGGEWSVPSGKVEIEVGDNILENTLKREILEEVGVQIGDSVVLLGNSSFTRVSGHNVVSLTFLCEWQSGEARPLEDQEEVRWMTLDEIMNFKDIPSYTLGRFNLLKEYISDRK